MRAVLAVFAVLAAVTAAGCTKKDPLYCVGVTGGPCGDGGTMEATGGDGSGDGGARCDTDPQCAGVAGKNHCDMAAHACVECLADNQCGGSLHGCDINSHVCVPCTTSAGQCSDVTPICAGAVCSACKTDGDCVSAYGANPGVCMADGHCASDADTIYAVAPAVGSCATADGTLAKPFCTAGAAVAAASAGPKAIVVLRGDFGNVSTSATAAPVTVVGQSATINPGGNIYGIDVTTGTSTAATASLSVRDLTITGGTSTSGAAAAHVSGGGASLALVNVAIQGNAGGGVVAENGSLIVMDRCVVKGNGGLSLPGLKTAVSAFHITNSVFANSSSGASLDVSVPTGGDSVFRNNDLLGNAFGLLCSGSFASGLILFNNTTDTGPNCTPVSCCTGDPLLTADYHLMSGSPCLDRLSPDPLVPFDIDGQPRPQAPAGTAAPKSDCGADELVPQ
jgi:hypothetical protein